MENPIIYTSKNIVLLKDVPVLNDGQFYIYVMLNHPQGNIKIGKTTNIQQRLQSLSGSNGGGSKIVKLYCSPATYVKSLESALHDYYNKYRILGTEWFEGENLDFDKVINHINSLFYTRSYLLCNEIRKNIYEKEQENMLESTTFNNEIKDDSNIKNNKTKKTKGKK